MDYRTKAINRLTIRRIANEIREIFESEHSLYFDVIKALELMPVLFENVEVMIVEDNDPELINIPSKIDLINNIFYIKIKESIYDKAYEKDNGGYRMHIMHEISHYFLFSKGYLPIEATEYKNYYLNSYESIEWQAKALAGEILIPYDLTKSMSAFEIMSKCKVSLDAANKRLKM